MTGDPVERMERYRLEQAEEALADAKILVANSAGRNSILNRAYYAMFYAVLALAERKRFASSKHRGILAFFDKEFVMTGTFPKEMSKNLHKAYDLRLIPVQKVRFPGSAGILPADNIPTKPFFAGGTPALPSFTGFCAGLKVESRLQAHCPGG